MGASLLFLFCILLLVIGVLLRVYLDILKRDY